MLRHCCLRITDPHDYLVDGLTEEPFPSWVGHLEQLGVIARTSVMDTSRTRASTN